MVLDHYISFQFLLKHQQMIDILLELILNENFQFESTSLGDKNLLICSSTRR
jgi:hypothetical protein